MQSIIVMALAISLIVTILDILNGLLLTDKEKIKIADNIIDEINETINKINKKDVRVVVDLNPTNML